MKEILTKQFKKRTYILISEDSYDQVPDNLKDNAEFSKLFSK